MLVIYIYNRYIWGFPGHSGGKKSACNAEDLDSIPGLGRSSGEGNGNPLQYSCLENSTDRGAWWATIHEDAKNWARLSDEAQHSTWWTHNARDTKSKSVRSSRKKEWSYKKIMVQPGSKQRRMWGKYIRFHGKPSNFFLITEPYCSLNCMLLPTTPLYFPCLIIPTNAYKYKPFFKNLFLVCWVSTAACPSWWGGASL